MLNSEIESMFELNEDEFWHQIQKHTEFFSYEQMFNLIADLNNNQFFFGEWSENKSKNIALFHMFLMCCQDEEEDELPLMLYCVMCSYEHPDAYIEKQKNFQHIDGYEYIIDGQKQRWNDMFVDYLDNMDKSYIQKVEESVGGEFKFESYEDYKGE